MKTLTGDELRMVAYPMGGMGAGMFCLEGSGMLGHFSLRNAPNFNLEPNVFSAVCVLSEKGENTARILEGPIPYRKVFGGAGDGVLGMGTGLPGKNYGLPRMTYNDFSTRFPFATLRFRDDRLPLEASLTGFSPFIPLNADDSSLPVASLEYTFTNPTEAPVRAVYSFNASNFMSLARRGAPIAPEERPLVTGKDDGFVLSQPPMADQPWSEGYFYARVDDPDALINTDWFDGGDFDVLTMLWNGIKAGTAKQASHPNGNSPGGSVQVPFALAPGGRKTITVKLAWYVPKTNMRYGWEAEQADSCHAENAPAKPCHVPWYAGSFGSVGAVMDYFTAEYDRLQAQTRRFSDTFYNTTLPELVVDSIAANLTILKSPTLLRQTDGRVWAWEGCCDTCGSCTGSCTHVWNYAQAMCHLFPELERSLRLTEFYESQNDEGHQNFRASLPIRPSGHTFHAASDGQLGGIMKMHREWRISGDTQWIASHYDRMKKSLEYCIATWDPDEVGALTEPHHNTYDIEFWGADGMCTGFYAGALSAMARISKALGKDADAARYVALGEKSRRYMREKLFNGEYFIQRVEWKNLHASLDIDKEAAENPQARALLEKEGPKYQYGEGCISDGVLGSWLALMCGLGDVIDPEQIKSHLLAVYAHNFKTSLIEHENPQRPGYALGDEGGLLLCSWPHGGKRSLPFIYSDEVWTGIEHQVASHLMRFGFVDEALTVEQAVRDRYDGTKRNPFDEYECGRWYARAMSSYGMLQGLTGVSYDAVDKTLYASDANLKEYSTFLCTATGYGTVTMKDGKASLEVISGSIPVEKTVVSGATGMA